LIDQTVLAMEPETTPENRHTLLIEGRKPGQSGRSQGTAI